MTKKRKIILGILFLVLLGGGWAFFHWLGFLLQRPMPVQNSYNLPLRVIAGNGTPGFADGTSSQFNKPIRLAPFGPEAILVADLNNHAIRVVHLDGRTVTLAGGPTKKGHRDGPADQALFDSPHGVSVRGDGVIAVSEVGNNLIRLITPEKGAQDGQPSRYGVSTVAGVFGERGFLDGPAAKALLRYPHAVAWGPDGELYFADIGNSRVREIRDGVVTTVAGNGDFGSDDGPQDIGRLQYPMDLAVASDGGVLIADAGTSMVRRYEPGKGLSTPFPGIKFAMPHGLALSPDGDPIVAEMFAHRIVLLNKNHGLCQLCGSGEPGPNLDQLNRPAAVLVHAGYLWIADLKNHRILLAEWKKQG